MRLYKGAMCPNYCTEQWAIGRFAQYEADFTTGVMCFWPILAIRLNQLHKAGKILELLLRQSKKMSAPPYQFRNI